MLKKLTIRNFKAIRDMTIEFTPLTVLIGGNSCGKSTVLQALDFLRSAATRDIPEYLRERGWDFADLKSQCDGGANQPIEFISVWTLPVKKSPMDVKWTLSIDFKDKWIIQERIIKLSGESMILSYHNVGEKNKPASLGELNIQSSALKYVAGTSIDTDEIDPLFSFLSHSMNFELLSPDRMRSGNKAPRSRNIGAGGETLAACIDLMEKNDREKLDKLVSGIIGLNVGIKTFDLGNTVELTVDEQTSQNLFKINARHLSDGLLRIIAYAAISLEKENVYLTIDDEDSFLLTDDGDKLITDEMIEVRNGMILFDEIEDGINPYLTEKVIDLLRGIVNNLGRQVIITTHSPIIVDDINPEELVFLWKDDAGAVQGKKMFSTEEMRELLKALYPGEVWVNLDTNSILKRLNVESNKKGSA
jgi:predicted ATPase